MKMKHNIGMSMVEVWGRKGRRKQRSGLHLSFYVHLASI